MVRKIGLITTFLLMLSFSLVAALPAMAADAPTINGAETNVTGSIITITFNKAMANPSGDEGQFNYQINGGANQAFSVSALHPGDSTSIDLTTSGTAIAYGDAVTVNYTAGTVVAEDGGVLASFVGQSVVNSMPAPTSTPTETPTSTPTATPTPTSPSWRPPSSRRSKLCSKRYRLAV